ncbi:MAG: helix-turn-helix domain-containing protein [Alphaproteobacteria bacterium]|nr:helix-turn-helix domain-containing protein [Alphaproteobacteria bacterium]
MGKKYDQANIAFNQALGKHIRMARQGAGMTQPELARKIDVTFQQIQKYESGVNNISAYKLNQLSRALGVSFAPFASTSDGLGPTHVVCDAHQFRLVAKLGRLDAHLVRLVETIVDKL